jgi:hypothetical protein
LTSCLHGRVNSKTLFEEVWGDSLDIKFPHDTEEICETPGGNFPTAMPIELTPEDRAKANDVYDHWGQSISKFERSLRVSAFSSKFDAFLAGNYTLTADEMAGYNLCALISKLFDESGEGLTPSHAVKGDRRYRYYLSGAKEQSQAITSHASFCRRGDREMPLRDQLKAVTNTHLLFRAEMHSGRQTR